MATYTPSDEQPHGIAVLALDRDETEALFALLAGERSRGAITDNTTLGDVVDAMEADDSHVTERERAALRAACA